MLSFFTFIWEWIKWIFGALTPFKQGREISPVVRWIIWILLDVTFVLLLYFLDDWYLKIGVQLVGRMPLPRRMEGLKEYWLPILGQLFILTGVVLYWFYLLWFSTADDSPFPDIDEAWQEGMRAIEHAGIQLPRVPLFLVLGRPGSSEEHLFEASGLKLVVKQTPTSPHAPVHVFADRDAVYVTCRGASVLGKLANILAMEDVPEGASVQDPDAEENLESTQKVGKKDQKILEMLRASMGQETIAPKKRAMRRAALGKPLGNDFLSDPKEVGRFKARLAHLSALINQGRQPFCAANGILLLVPLAGTDTLGEAQLTAQACQEDLSVVRQVMKLDCPLVSLLVDMEDLPGFVDFIRCQPPKELGNRRGNGFPMATRLSREEVLGEIEKSLSWVCTTYLQDSVYRVFQGEKPTSSEGGPFYPGNARLVLLLDEMNERAESLSVIIQQAASPGNDTLLRYAGCYMAATGPRGSQGFVAGVIQKLVKEQSCVGWTEAALAEDAQCHTRANYYFMLAGVLFMVWGLLLGWLIFRMIS